jgi:enoyl-CoA hydratase/carnithine racemase
MADLVLVEINDGVGELILNRPAQRNSLIGPLVNALNDGLQQLANDQDCRSIILRGNEGYFCAGLDLKAFAEDPAPAWKAHFQEDWATFHNNVFNCAKPIVGALEGFAIAGGSALAFACDYLVVGKKSFLHVAEVERGLQAPINLAWLSIRHSYALALKMAVLGQRHYGDELVALGIANSCVDDADVVAEARTLAQRLAGFNPTSVQGLKQALLNVKAPTDFLKVVQKIKAG